MNRYGRTGLRVLGGLLALVLAATLLPAAVYAAGGAYQVDEDSVYMNMEDSRPAALAAQASMAAADNVAMQLFNYTGDINGQGPLEFYHSWGASVDGDASGSGARPSMSPTLEDNKWPYVTGIPGSKASGSLGYLFSDSAVPGKTVYSVDSVDFDAGTVDAAMLRSRAVYLRALAEAEQVPELNSDALTAAPGVGQSTAQVVHNVDDLAAKR